MCIEYETEEINTLLNNIKALSEKIRENKSGADITFIFPGQGSTGAVPLTHLCRNFPVYGSYISRAEKKILQISNINIKELIIRGKTKNTVEEQLFSVVHGTAMAEQYKAFGIKPLALAGHSVGEITACVVSGAMGFETALEYTYNRAMLMEKYAGGGIMLTAALDSESALEYAKKCGGLSLAAINDREACVLSGMIKEIKKLELLLDKRGIKHKRLRVPVAAHSSYLDPALEDIGALSTGELSEFESPVYSAVTGRLLTLSELKSSEWKKAHARNTVLFMETLKSIKKVMKQKKIFIEFAVHRVLAPSGMKTVRGSKWLGASSMSCYRENKSTEYCFTKGIEESLSEIEKYSCCE